ncbi:MAG: transposase [Candidatus Riflebacteria bacterium]
MLPREEQKLAILFDQMVNALKRQGMSERTIGACSRVVFCLKYLSRHLYRGIIAEKRIISNENGLVTFLWREGKTRKWRRKTLPGTKFLCLIVQHTLPCGFRRAREKAWADSTIG